MIVSRILDLHAEEAALAWLRRDLAAAQPHFRLNNLFQLDGRLDAHLDGLRIAERSDPRAAWKVCEQELQWVEPGEVFSAAVLAWESGQEERIQPVMKAAATSYECSRAMVSSLGWLTDEQARPHIDHSIAHSNAFQRRVGIAVCAVRGRDPGDALPKAVASSDKLLKARALQAIGELARRDLLAAAKEALRTRDIGCKFAAAWSLARLSDDPKAIEVLKKIVELQPSIDDQLRFPEYAACFPEALHLVLRKIEAKAAAKWLKKLANDPKLVRQSVIGTGIVGTPDSIPWLLSVMSMPELARVAGEAFSMITGVDLPAEKLDGNKPVGFQSGPTEDPEDENVALDEDENLPWPDAVKLALWWERRQSEFEPQTRYLCGKSLTQEGLEHVLRHGYQRQRAAAALELAIRNPDQPLFNVRAPAFRQQQWLGLK